MTIGFDLAFACEVLLSGVDQCLLMIDYRFVAACEIETEIEMIDVACLQTTLWSAHVGYH